MGADLAHNWRGLEQDSLLSFITDTPRVSFVLAYYKNPKNISTIIKRIRLCGDDIEIIIHNDGQTDVGLINESLHKTNEYQICSNNLNELRMYNNGVKMANAEIAIISQDDDIPPDNANWITESLQEFEKDPELGVLSLYKGGKRPWREPDDIKLRLKKNRPLHGLAYVAWSAFGPWFIRKEAFAKCGGFSTEYSNVGEGGCGGVDSALCAEMWLHGYKVAMLDTDATRQWKRHVGVRNSLRNSKIQKERDDRIEKNVKIYRKNYSKDFIKIIEKIKEADVV